MKDFALTGGVFGFFHFVVSSSIRDRPIRTHKKLIVYNCLVNYIAIYWAKILRRRCQRSEETNGFTDKYKKMTGI
jgi:hypothetical protein